MSPARIRDAYMSCVFEALIQYAATGGELRLVSDREADGGLRISFSLSDNDDYQHRLSALLAERSEGAASS